MYRHLWKLPINLFSGHIRSNIISWQIYVWQVFQEGKRDMNYFKKVFLFILGVVFILSLAYSNSFNRGDYNTKRLVLKKGSTVNYLIDLRKEGFIKRILQPQTYSSYLRVNLEEAAQLQCKAETKDMQIYLSQGSKKGLWPELKENMILKSNNNRLIKTQNVMVRAEKNIIPINVEIKLNDDVKADSCEGNLVFTEKGKLYGIIKITVLRS